MAREACRARAARRRAGETRALAEPSARAACLARAASPERGALLVRAARAERGAPPEPAARAEAVAQYRQAEPEILVAERALAVRAGQVVRPPETAASVVVGARPVGRAQEAAAPVGALAAELMVVVETQYQAPVAARHLPR